MEMQPESGSLIVRYDPGVHKPASVVNIVRRMLRAAISRMPTTSGDVTRGRI